MNLKRIHAPAGGGPHSFWNQVSQKGLRFALTLSPTWRLCTSIVKRTQGAFARPGSRYVEGPAKQAGRAAPRLVKLSSPYRFVLNRSWTIFWNSRRTNPGRQIAVLIPELVERHWYHYFLHNQRGELLRALLLAKGSQNLVLDQRAMAP